MYQALKHSDMQISEHNKNITQLVTEELSAIVENYRGAKSQYVVGR